MTATSTWRHSFLLAGLLSLVSGAAVAVVLQDGSVLIPFVVAVPFATPAIHGLRTLRTSTLRLLGLLATVAGAAAIVYGHFISDDGTVQALGVLGGTVATTAGLLTIAVATVGRLRSRQQSDWSNTPASSGPSSRQEGS